VCNVLGKTGYTCDFNVDERNVHVTVIDCKRSPDLHRFVDLCALAERRQRRVEADLSESVILVDYIGIRGRLNVACSGEELDE
jgi:hypothetical protein